MNLALLVAHAHAVDEHVARQMVRGELTSFGVKMHIGQLAQVENFPLEYFADKPVKLTRYSAGL